MIWWSSEPSLVASDLKTVGVSEWSSIEPSEVWSSWRWWAWSVQIRTRNTIIMERKTSPDHTKWTFLFNGLQCLTRISENASFTDSHSIRFSMSGYTFSSFWIECVYASTVLYSLLVMNNPSPQLPLLASEQVNTFNTYKSIEHKSFSIIFGEHWSIWCINKPIDTCFNVLNAVRFCLLSYLRDVTDSNSVIRAVACQILIIWWSWEGIADMRDTWIWYWYVFIHLEFSTKTNIILNCGCGLDCFFFM